LPFVECRLVTENGSVISTPHDVLPDTEVKDWESECGELQVRGPTVFKEYLNNPKATNESFCDGHWFRTGDIAAVNHCGVYRILGRQSTDIIKSNGFKISALEIERVLLSHAWIQEVAVSSIPDKISGELIIAVLVLRKIQDVSFEQSDLQFETVWNNTNLNDDAMQNIFEHHIRTDFLEKLLSPYKHPKKYYFVNSLPRNHLGKVNKKTLLKDCSIHITL
jgi:acyl-CoA synthetase (AMP-forming)/AMP-acid ligase II